MKQETREDDVHPVDRHYASLKCELNPMEKENEEYQLVAEYLAKTHASTHSIQMGLKNVFRVGREGEADNEEVMDKIGNRKLLWHGSRLSNYFGILSQGLRIAPPEAPATGYMFGKGVYFADMASKSGNYCYVSEDGQTGFLLLAEVALGEENLLKNADYNANNLPTGKHSTWGLGRTMPNPAQNKQLNEKVVVPCGKPIANSMANDAGLLYNEFIVYNTQQIRLRYLLESVPEWEKVLWRRQPFPDNYSGGEERFLKDLRKNVSVVLYTWPDAFRACIHILVHLNIIVLSFLLFETIYYHSWSSTPSSIISSILVMATYLYYICSLRDRNLPSINIVDHCHTMLTIGAVGYALIPIIRSLTTTISTDTIYAMAFGSGIISCLAHDYGLATPLVSRPLSLSTGLSSSVLLISRLQEDSSAFFYLCVSFILHAYIAPVRNRLNEAYPNAMLVLAAILAALSTVVVSWMSDVALAAWWALCQLLIGLAVPSYLMLLQRGKRTIHGPWDEAVLRRKL
ncbi:hypothetical protein PENTCL1PPCAC_30398 [Pristionchus entomophagus]|uniref:Poly [ADP-ribose] polymerase n=1 Tax=Pristionchus entomophagus TaxID=358040 RepID=A0AAV5U8C2_9BILA|nr:hypothetical protein PENTCL1PPCAC_25284 [Pristionchus entomophagus]GMT08224.1 hypothetical protein PENTCL1PPCAC_30398 [Pristionchus entomophagus]